MSELVGFKDARIPKKALLVNVSKTALLMEEMILEQRTSCDCVTAHDGSEALDCAVRKNTDLMFIDVVMRRVNGFAACKAGYQCGRNGYLNKPVRRRIGFVAAELPA